MTLCNYKKSIVFEHDLIHKCKEHYDSVYVNALIDKFQNKEIFYSWNKEFYLCSGIHIENIGESRPSYDYVFCLKNEKQELKVRIVESNYIILADEYREELRKREENRLKEEAARKDELEKEEREYRRQLINMYGQRKALLILEGKVELGFTKEMCAESWGAPYDINRTITRYSVSEQWVYGLDCYLYFEGDKLVAIQNSESSSYYW